MPNIKKIKNAGFCYGVERAYNMALEELRKQNGKVYSLGDLIHNKEVVNQLNKLGAVPIRDLSRIDDTENSSVIIRAHGVSKEISEKIKTMGLRKIDATCPFVKVPQNAVKEYGRKGYFIFIAGDEGHPEVEGIKSYVSENQRMIIKSIDDIKINEKIKKAALVSQTTLSFDTFSLLAVHLMKITEELVVINSICDATDIRQKETKDLAKESDLIIVIGGMHSANTKRLKEIAAKFTVTYQVETENDLRKEWFCNKENIGITAGASTPDFIIKRVEDKIKQIIKEV